VGWRGGKGEEEGGGSPMCARWRRGLGIGEAVDSGRRGLPTWNSSRVGKLLDGTAGRRSGRAPEALTDDIEVA
jgi:hypothetical protein